MAQNLTINGVTYNDVSSLSVPLAAGGNATFPDTSDATAVAADMLSGKTAYVNGALVTGTIASKATATYTPGTSNQTIAAGQYLSGVQTISGDSDLKAANVKKGVGIFGVTGTYTSDATATAANILSGKTAYVNGSKLTGTIASKTAATYTPSTADQSIASGQYLSGAQTVKGDANLVAANIASGVSIFGVTGTLSTSTLTITTIDSMESVLFNEVVYVQSSGGNLVRNTSGFSYPLTLSVPTNSVVQITFSDQSFLINASGCTYLKYTDRIWIYVTATTASITLEAM